MNMRDLEAFLAVVEAGSITAASARLHLTQPGVSRRIQLLEQTLGVALLDRQAKPLKPTVEGLQAYAHGRRILGEVEDLRTVFSAHGQIGGELRLGTTPYLSDVAMGEPLDRLRSEFPDLTLRVVVGWSEQLLEKLRHGEIDAAAFCSPDGVDPARDVEAQAIGVQPLLVVAPKAMKLPSKVGLSRLAQCHWVLNQDGCATGSLLRRRFEQEGVALRIGIEALDSQVRLSLVARGHGLTLSTRRALAASPERASLRSVSVAGFEPKVAAWIVHRPAVGRLSRPIRCFKDAVAEAFAAVAVGRRAVLGSRP